MKRKLGSRASLHGPNDSTRVGLHVLPMGVEGHLATYERFLIVKHAPLNGDDLVAMMLRSSGVQ